MIAMGGPHGRVPGEKIADALVGDDAIHWPAKAFVGTGVMQEVGQMVDR